MPLEILAVPESLVFLEPEVLLAALEMLDPKEKLAHLVPLVRMVALVPLVLRELVDSLV